MLAGVVIPDERGRICLIRRIEPARWEIPGGKVESGESPLQAAKREASEEIGYEGTVVRSVETLEFVEAGCLYRYHYFLVTPSARPLQIVERQRFDAVRFFSLREALSEQSGFSVAATSLLSMVGLGSIDEVWK